MLRKSRKLSKKEAEQQRTINEILDNVKEWPEEILMAMMGDIVHRTQPIIIAFFRTFYRQDEYRKHQNSLLQITIWIWRYYSHHMDSMKISCEESLIDDPLWIKMSSKNKEWLKELSQQNMEIRTEMRHARFNGHPSGLMMQKLENLLITNPSESLIELSIDDRYYLVNAFSILLDCYEELIKKHLANPGLPTTSPNQPPQVSKIVQYPRRRRG